MAGFFADHETPNARKATPTPKPHQKDVEGPQSSTAPPFTPVVESVVPPQGEASKVPSDPPRQDKEAERRKSKGKQKAEDWTTGKVPEDAFPNLGLEGCINHSVEFLSRIFHFARRTRDAFKKARAEAEEQAKRAEEINTALVSEKLTFARFRVKSKEDHFEMNRRISRSEADLASRTVELEKTKMELDKAVAERKATKELSELLKVQLEAKDRELEELRKAVDVLGKRLNDSERAFAHWREVEQVELCQEYWLKGDTEAKQVVDIFCAEKGIE
jgi:hypothetical protein